MLCHPFFTGKSVARHQGDPADWDIFLFYIVTSDNSHVEAFYTQLTSLGLESLVDAECMLPGDNWEEGF